MGTITKIGQIAIPAKDIERATAFYKDQLGLQLLFTTETMAFFRLRWRAPFHKPS